MVLVPLELWATGNCSLTPCRTWLTNQAAHREHRENTEIPTTPNDPREAAQTSPCHSLRMALPKQNCTLQLEDFWIFLGLALQFYMGSLKCSELTSWSLESTDRYCMVLQ